jgi:GNAT superfamily N-acetyltransferase
MIFKDEWLSKQLSKNTYQLEINDLSEIAVIQEWKEFKKEHKDEDLFVFSKIRPDAVKVWQSLEKEDFKLIDTNVNYELHGVFPDKGEQRNETHICFAEKRHQKAMGEIARDNFIYSRFHLDPLIDCDIASQIKQNWVQNYFVGKRGDKMVVALMKGMPVGFLQLIINDTEIIIDLIGVDKKAQGKGIASAMIQFSGENIGFLSFKVGTQIGNIPSIKLYQKLGFIFSGSDYVFHYHS